MERSSLRIAVTEEKFRRCRPDFKTEARDLFRLDYAAQLAVGASVLDIGIAEGMLVHHLADQKRFEQVTGVDIRRHSKRVDHPDVSYLEHDLRTGDPAISRHDTVFCMEVIEHCEAQHNDVMLETLRSLAGRRLVVSVPYNEPEPLWWHDRPGGHRQRFPLPALSRLFPRALATIIPRYGVDWVLLVEDGALPIHYFQIVERERLVHIAAAADADRGGRWRV